MTLSLSEAGPGRFGRQVSVTDIYHTIPSCIHWGRVPSVHRAYYPVLAWPINLQAYATIPYYAECSRAPDYINVGFLGRWGTCACPQCLPSDTVPIRSWTRTLRPPGIRHRHLPYHAIRYDTYSFRMTSGTSLPRGVRLAKRLHYCPLATNNE